MHHKATTSDSQLILPFSARLGEQLAFVRMIETADLPLSPGRLRGVADLLQRIIMLSDGSEREKGVICVRASLCRLSKEMRQVASVSERTIKNWSRDAQALGLLIVDVRNKRHGFKAYNDWTIDLQKIKLAIARGNSGKLQESISPPRCETVSPPRCESISHPLPIAQIALPASSQLAEFLISKGIARRLALDLAPAILAKHHGDESAAITSIERAFDTATHPRNAALLRSPAGAAVHFLRDGTWPAEGIFDPANSQPPAKPRLNPAQLAHMKWASDEARRRNHGETWFVRQCEQFGIPAELIPQKAEVVA